MRHAAVAGRIHPALLALLAAAGAGIVVVLLWTGGLHPALGRAEAGYADGALAGETLAELNGAIRAGALGPDEADRAATLYRNVLAEAAWTADAVREAAVGLALVGGPDALPGLLGLIGEDGRDDATRIAAADAVAAIGARLDGARGETVEALAGLARRPRLAPEVRIAVVQALERLWSRPALDALAVVAEDAGAARAVRLAALGALGRRLTLESPAMRTVLRLYGDPDPALAAAADRALAAARTRESLSALYGLQGTVGKAMETVGGIERANAERQRQLMDRMDGNGANADAASDSERILRRLADSDPAVRLGAAYDLGRLGDADAVGPLVDRLVDSEADVRRAAARALLRLAPVQRPDRVRLHALLEHEDADIRAETVRLLGALGDRESLDALAALAETDPRGRVRAAVADALAALGGPRAAKALDALAAREAGNTRLLGIINAARKRLDASGD